MARNIPTDLLRTFVLAIETGTFTAASERVGRTQSAVSLRIKRLEEIIGTQLIKRDARNLILTESGTSLEQYARRILSLNDEALAVLNSQSVSGHIRLGAPHEYTASLLPKLLGRFAHAYPNVLLEVTSDLSKNLLQQSMDGAYDLVVALDDKRAHKGRRIHREPLVWFTSADHDRLRESPVPLVLAPAPCIYRARMLKVMKESGSSVRVSYLSSSYDAILSAVRAGFGVTAMARSTIPSDAYILTERDGLPSLGHLQLYLHRSAGSDAGSAITCLEDYIVENFSSAK